MKIIEPQNATSTVITVTDTATNLFDLIDTAGGVSNSQSYFNDPDNEGPANGILITPQDGSVRGGYGITPTASLGMLLYQGVKYYIPNINLSEFDIIRTGSSDVSCSIELAESNSSESIQAIYPNLSVGGTIDGDLLITGDLTVLENFTFGDVGTDQLTVNGISQFNESASFTPDITITSDTNDGSTKPLVINDSDSVEVLSVDSNSNVAIGSNISITSGDRDNILIDGELELWDDSTTLTHWETLGFLGGSIEQESSVVYSGTYAAKLNVVDDNPIAIGQLKTGLTVGEKYNVKLYSRYITSGTTSFAVANNSLDSVTEVYDWDSATWVTFTGEPIYNDFATTESYTEFTSPDFTVPASGNIYIIIITKNGESRDGIYVDEISLETATGTSIKVNGDVVIGTETNNMTLYYDDTLSVPAIDSSNGRLLLNGISGSNPAIYLSNPTLTDDSGNRGSEIGGLGYTAAGVIHTLGSITFNHDTGTGQEGSFTVTLNDGDDGFTPSLDVLKILSNGNVGIGLSNPEAKLHIREGSGSAYTPLEGTVVIYQSNENTYTNSRFGYLAGTAGEAIIDYGDVDDQDAGGLKYSNITDAFSIRTNGVSDRLLIDANGVLRLGLNTDLINSSVATGNGVSILDLKAYSENASAFRIIPKTDSAGFSVYGENMMSFYEVHSDTTGNERYVLAMPETDASGILQISRGATPRDFVWATATDSTAYTERMRLTKDGRLLVGKTTDRFIMDTTSGIGEIPDGELFGSYTNDNITILPATSTLTAGKKFVLAYYNGATYNSILEYAHSSGGAGTYSDLYLSKSGGNVGINTGSNAPLASLHIGNRNTINSVDSAMLVSRTINSGTGNAHGYSDSSDFARTGDVAYNSYDARVNITGTTDYDHYIAFQDAPTLNFTGTMDNLYGGSSVPTLTNGNVTNRYGWLSKEIAGSGGAVTNQYGLYVEDLTKATNNWAVYTAGTTKSYFGGNVGIGETAPSYNLVVKSASSQAFIATDGYTNNYSGYRIMENGSDRWTITKGGTTDNLYIGRFNSSGVWQGDSLVILNSNGYFGINDDTPNYQLDVNGTVGINGILTMQGSDSNIALGSNYLSGDGSDEGISIDSNGLTTLKNNITDTFVSPANFSTPNITAGQGAYISLGKAGTEYNSASINFTYVGAGSTSNRLGFGFSYHPDLLVVNGEGKVGIGTSSPDTTLDVNGAITARELSADPSDPDEGAHVIWQSDGTGSGDDGDIMIKITAGATTKTITLVDFSAY